ncbi:MAG: S41 family peptidase [Flavobacteriales bacterium]|jgi:carboxyl-terminal processing protease
MNYIKTSGAALFVMFFFHCKMSIAGDKEVGSIASIIKVWGFLNYQSSYVLESSIHWDEELLRALEGYDSSQDARLAISSLFQKLPAPKRNSDAIIDWKVYSRCAWIESDTLLDIQTKARLKEMLISKKPFPNRYLDRSYADVIKFKNPHDIEWDYKNRNHRLLTLALYWTKMNFFNPYQELLPSWDQTLIDLIPIFINADSEEDFYVALLQMNARIEDSHSEFNVFPLTMQEKIFGKYFLDGVKLSHRGDTVYVEAKHPEAKQELQEGDILLEIEGYSVTTLLDSIKKIGSFSYHNVSRMMRMFARSKTTSRLWKIKRGNESLNVIANYVAVDKVLSVPPDATKGLYPDSMMYIMPEGLTLKELKVLLKAARKKAGVILDMRCYPKGQVATLSTFFSARYRHFATMTTVDPQRPGCFKYKKVKTSFFGRRYKKPVTVIVSDRTQSASEYTVMAIQTNPNVKVVGTRTAGANGEVLTIHLPGGYTCVYSSTGVYYPDGRPNQKEGVRIIR